MSADPRVVWRRLRRRPASTQWRFAALAVAVVGGVIAWVATAPSATTVASANPTAGLGTTRHAATSVDRASTAAPGVTSDTIRVAFPLVSLNSLAGQLGFARDSEYGLQSRAIQVFVDDINAHGGIGGRRIVPEIDVFDPTDEAGMRALCKNWTASSDPAFAVIDGLGTYEGDNQLCVTQEGDTPMLAQWSTVTAWTTAGSPEGARKWVSASRRKLRSVSRWKKGRKTRRSRKRPSAPQRTSYVYEVEKSTVPSPLER